MTDWKPGEKIIMFFVLVIVGLFIFGSILSASHEIKIETIADEWCVSNGWKGAHDTNYMFGFYQDYYCYKYVDGFYEQSPILDRNMLEG